MKNFKHGYNQTGKRKPEYKAWDAVIQRCTNPNDARYPDYGGRGIYVCERWMDFCGFIEDLGDRPDGTSLGRINNDGHYSCGQCEQCRMHGREMNCRWETPLQQMNNTRRSHYIEFKGERITLAEAGRRLGWPYGIIHGRLNIGWPLEKALSVPWPAKKGAY